MTDDRTDESETEGGDSSHVDDGGTTDESETTKPGGLSTPGGGPRKVVSSTSVDDILESLNSTSKAEERTDDESDTETHRRTDTTVSATDDSEDGSSSDVPDPAADTPTELTFDEDETQEDDAATDTDSLESEETSTAGTDTVDVDDAVSALRTNLEGDAVSGADVRAAEHGEGREKTPEIDEVDLLLDDLEESSSTVSTPPTSNSGDGPLAGRIDSDAPVHQDRTLEGEENDGETEVGTGNGDGESGDSANEDDSAGGLLDRIRGLFSR